MKLGIIRDFMIFIMENKKWWVGTVFMMLLLLAVLIFLSEGSSLAPFIYALF